MFNFLIFGSLIVGVVIAWIGLFGNKDHNDRRR